MEEVHVLSGSDRKQKDKTFKKSVLVACALSVVIVLMYLLHDRHVEYHSALSQKKLYEHLIASLSRANAQAQILQENKIMKHNNSVLKEFQNIGTFNGSNKYIKDGGEYEDEPTDINELFNSLDLNDNEMMTAADYKPYFRVEEKETTQYDTEDNSDFLRQENDILTTTEYRTYSMMEEEEMIQHKTKDSPEFLSQDIELLTTAEYKPYFNIEERETIQYQTQDSSKILRQKEMFSLNVQSSNIQKEILEETTSEIENEEPSLHKEDEKKKYKLPTLLEKLLGPSFNTYLDNFRLKGKENASSEKQEDIGNATVTPTQQYTDTTLLHENNMLREIMTVIKEDNHTNEVTAELDVIHDNITKSLVANDTNRTESSNKTDEELYQILMKSYFNANSSNDTVSNSSAEVTDKAENKEVIIPKQEIHDFKTDLNTDNDDLNKYTWDLDNQIDDGIPCVLMRTQYSSFQICLHDVTEDPDVSAMLKATGTWGNSFVQDVQLAVLTHSDTGLIDVSAGIGVFTLAVASVHRNVVSIEPSLSHIQRIQKAVKINNVREYVKLYRNVISDQSMAMTLNYRDTNINHVNITAVDPDSVDTNADIVHATTLNNLAKLITLNKAVLRIDMSGFIKKALQSSEVLFKKVDIVAVFIPWDINDPELCAFMVEFLEDKHYKPYSRLLSSPLDTSRAQEWTAKYILWEKNTLQ